MSRFEPPPIRLLAHDDIHTVQHLGQVLKTKVLAPLACSPWRGGQGACPLLASGRLHGVRRRARGCVDLSPASQIAALPYRSPGVDGPDTYNLVTPFAVARPLARGSHSAATCLAVVDVDKKPRLFCSCNTLTWASYVDRVPASCRVLPDAHPTPQRIPDPLLSLLIVLPFRSVLFGPSKQTLALLVCFDVSSLERGPTHLRRLLTGELQQHTTGTTTGCPSSTLIQLRAPHHPQPELVSTRSSTQDKDTRRASSLVGCFFAFIFNLRSSSNSSNFTGDHLDPPAPILFTVAHHHRFQLGTLD
ncbi:uncharacterized protein B0I36DRAFT_118304 [Microdochium trichocladiopsis]|uniref:Uncharacterized protein n=1 Tax=Microdochium trichocladiopsis TaxID=1682393 RepID=A0A9P9BQN7_9PEZI|nr:uncharacterized protein B0I36DRAFT_118304 [Microdochium trichocladiopsis]KAH7031083.1 hypothetical protein B0I36DRAFT_118304 [Microdochium trichocladiopsis]